MISESSLNINKSKVYYPPPVLCLLAGECRGWANGIKKKALHIVQGPYGYYREMVFLTHHEEAFKTGSIICPDHHEVGSLADITLSFEFEHVSLISGCHPIV